MMDIQFNAQQLVAVDKVIEWYKGFKNKLHRKQVFFLAGYAGTGKTTVALHCAESCTNGNVHKVEFIAPTGKAASRLRAKGCLAARTFHQFVYNFRGETEDGELIFLSKGALGNVPELIILDEASMIGGRDYQNLLSFGVPILALGDIGQLPPVKSAAAFTGDHVDVLLDEIQRQGKDSNIIRASFYVRKGHTLPEREYDDVKVRRGKPSIEDLVNHSGEDAQILCSYNNTRHRINSQIRKKLGYTDALPQVGEKVVCRFNQHGFGIMNGEQGIVLGYETIDTDKDNGEYVEEDKDDDGKRIVLKSLTEDRKITAKFNELVFTGNDEEKLEASKKPGAFDFGYALTVHSSQGSEWADVLVMEEKLNSVDHSKLMYTAITRAQKRLMIYR